MLNGKTLTRKPKSHAVHNGPIVGTGFSCPTEKQNHGLIIIPGLWRVRLCEGCGEFFSRPADLLIANVVPSDDVVRAFAEQEGVPVTVENAA